MDEILSISEIEARFASEWVLIEDPKTDEGLEVRGGTVCRIDFRVGRLTLS